MKKHLVPNVLSAAFLLLLLALPAVCLAFGGKVSYPNGKPAVGAQVNLFVDDASKQAPPSPPSPMAQSPGAGPSGVSGNGMPGSMAKNMGQNDPATPSGVGNQLLTPKKKSTATCNASGRFQFSDQLVSGAMIQIQAADGNDFATVTLPASVFAKGEVAIVLQPKH